MMESELLETETGPSYEKFCNADHELFLLSSFAQENSSRDCVIQSQDGYFLCHKLILAASNSFFKEILQSFDTEEPAYVLMIDYQMQEVEELLSTAYKQSLQTSELRQLFFSQTTPNQLTQINAERFKIKQEILGSIKCQQNTANETEAQGLMKVETILIKEESPPHEEMFVEPDFPLGASAHHDDYAHNDDWIQDEAKSEQMNGSHKRQKNEIKSECGDVLSTEPFNATQEEGTEGGGQVLKKKKKRRRRVKEETECKPCEQTFHSRDEYKDHLFNIHGQVLAPPLPPLPPLSRGPGRPPLVKSAIKERVKCEECEKDFATRGNLRVHVKTAHTEVNLIRFQCSECGQTLSSSSALNNHMSLHRPPTTPCPVCGKLFHNKKYVERHAKQAHAELQEWKFVCKVCNKGFTERKKLEEHEYVHTNLKPFKCRWCERTYRNPSNQRAHEKTSHSEEYTSRLSNNANKSRNIIQVKLPEPEPEPEIAPMQTE